MKPASQDDDDDEDETRRRRRMKKVDELIQERKIFDAAKELLSATNKSSFSAAAAGVAENLPKKYRDVIVLAAEAARIRDVHLLSPVTSSSALTAPVTTAIKKTVSDKESNNSKSKRTDSKTETETKNNEWRKQGETHGNHDFIVYYKYSQEGKLLLRIESPIEVALVVPIIAALNETELYHTFMPQYKYPLGATFGLEATTKLHETGIGCQVLHAKFKMPFPMQDRDFVQETFTVDDIDEDGAIIIVANPVVDVAAANINSDTIKKDVDDDEDVVRIPPVAKNVVRMEATAGITFRRCPSDHPALLSSYTSSSAQSQKIKSEKTKSGATTKQTTTTTTKHQATESNNNLILITITSQADPKLAYIPQSFINFATRTAIGGIWASQLYVAESIRDGMYIVLSLFICGRLAKYFICRSSFPLTISTSSIPCVLYRTHPTPHTYSFQIWEN